MQYPFKLCENCSEGFRFLDLDFDKNRSFILDRKTTQNREEKDKLIPRTEFSFS